MLDNLNIFSDSQAITATADSTKKVHLGMPFFGKGTPVNLKVRVVEGFNNLTSLKVDLMQADTESGAYTSAESRTILLADLTKGADLGFRFIPRAVKKKWLKIAYTVTGTAPTTGKIFAALTDQEDARYEPGQFINRGVVVG